MYPSGLGNAWILILEGWKEVTEKEGSSLEITLVKDELLIKANVKKDAWRTSSTGKSQVLTTAGFTNVEGYKVSVNILKPVEKE